MVIIIIIIITTTTTTIILHCFSAYVQVEYYFFNMTLHFVNVYVDIMPYDRSINAPGYLYFVRHDRDRDILVRLDDRGIVLRLPVGGFYLNSTGSSVRFEVMAFHVFFLQSLLCLAAWLQWYPHLGLRKNDVLRHSIVNPTPNSQPGGSECYVGVFFPRNTLRLALLLRHVRLG
jgi:hypothetical protein